MQSRDKTLLSILDKQGPSVDIGVINVVDWDVNMLNRKQITIYTFLFVATLLTFLFCYSKLIMNILYDARSSFC